MSVVNMAVIREDSFIDTKVELWNKRKTRKGMGKEHFLSNTLIFIQISQEKKALNEEFITAFRKHIYFMIFYESVLLWLLLDIQRRAMNWIDILLEVEGIK